GTIAKKSGIDPPGTGQGFMAQKILVSDRLGGAPPGFWNEESQESDNQTRQANNEEGHSPTTSFFGGETGTTGERSGRILQAGQNVQAFVVGDDPAAKNVAQGGSDGNGQVKNGQSTVPLFPDE